MWAWAAERRGTSPTFAVLRNAPRVDTWKFASSGYDRSSELMSSAAAGHNVDRTTQIQLQIQTCCRTIPAQVRRPRRPLANGLSWHQGVTHRTLRWARASPRPSWPMTPPTIRHLPRQPVTWPDQRRLIPASSSALFSCSIRQPDRAVGACVSSRGHILYCSINFANIGRVCTRINPLKCSGIRWLHLKLFNAIQV